MPAPVYAHVFISEIGVTADRQTLGGIEGRITIGCTEWVPGNHAWDMRHKVADGLVLFSPEFQRTYNKVSVMGGERSCD